MCITFFNIEPNPDKKCPYKLILAFNRDEFIDKPTAALHFWEEDPNIVGGRDLKGMGTWLGINIKTGNIAFLTNLRKHILKKIFEAAKPTSRGTLLFNFLKTSFYTDRKIELGKCETSEIENIIADYMKEVLKNPNDWEPFNLVLGNIKTMTFKYMNNRTQEDFPRTLEPGSYGMTNCPLGEFWPKNELGLATFKKIHETCKENNLKKELIIEKLVEMMQDTTKHSIFEFTETSIFIEPYKVWFNEARATKTTSIVLIDDNNELTFVEHTNNVHRDQILRESKIYSTKVIEKKIEAY